MLVLTTAVAAANSATRCLVEVTLPTIHTAGFFFAQKKPMARKESLLLAWHPTCKDFYWGAE